MVIEKKLKKAIKSKNINIIDSVFEEIYIEYFNLITYIISKNVKNRNDVEELTDDVFMNFYTSCNKQDINNIKYYLVQTAKNISLNFLRKKNVQFEYNEDYINNYVTNDNKTDNSEKVSIINDTHNTNDGIYKLGLTVLNCPYPSCYLYTWSILSHDETITNIEVDSHAI